MICREDILPFIISPHGDDYILGATYFTNLNLDDYPINILNIADGPTDQRLDTVPIIDITREIENGIDSYLGISPGVILIPNICDRNQDHQIVHNASLPAVRHYRDPRIQVVIEYAIMDSTLESWTPNLFCPLSYAQMDWKHESMKRLYPHYYKYPRNEGGINAYHAYWARELPHVEYAEPYKILFMKGAHQDVGV